MIVGAAGGLPARCRTSWVCLEHHVTVVTNNGVTVCGSQFPPTVSKHCPHQHSSIHKTIQQYEVPTIPAVVISKGRFLSPTLWQNLFVTTADYCVMSVQTCKIKQIQNRKMKFQFSKPLSAEPLTLPHKMSNYQHTAGHSIQYATP